MRLRISALRLALAQGMHSRRNNALKSPRISPGRPLMIARLVLINRKPNPTNNPNLTDIHIEVLEELYIE